MTSVDPTPASGMEAKDHDWFKRNADVRNPKAAIRYDPAYFASECAAAITNGTLRSAGTSAAVGGAERKDGSPFTQLEHATHVIRDDIVPTVHSRQNTVTGRWETPTPRPAPVELEERAAFEKWAFEHWQNSYPPDAAWIGWQARAALSTVPAGEVKCRTCKGTGGITEESDCGVYVGAECPDCLPASNAASDDLAENRALALCNLEKSGLRVPASNAASDAVERLSPIDAWQDLVDKDDRTSPEEYPDYALISFDELADYMRGAEGRENL